eukprot:scaffold22607_cov123-Cylindrotheca_fusiformis.AAC.21
MTTSRLFLFVVVLLVTSNTRLVLAQEPSTLYFVVRPFTELVFTGNETSSDPTFGTTGELIATLSPDDGGERKLYKDPCNYINETARFDTYGEFSYRPGGVSPIGDATLVIGSDNRTVLLCERIFTLETNTTGQSDGVYLGENKLYRITEKLDKVYWRQIYSKNETCAGFCVSDSRVCQFEKDIVCEEEIDNAHRFGDGWWQVENSDGDLNSGPACTDQQECLDGSSALSVLLVLGFAATGSIIMTLVL